jgi:hypothetical protein
MVELILVFLAIFAVSIGMGFVETKVKSGIASFYFWLAAIVLLIAIAVAL